MLPQLLGAASGAAGRGGRGRGFLGVQLLDAPPPHTPATHTPTHAEEELVDLAEQFMQAKVEAPLEPQAAEP